jgi:hypothetical protein
MTGSLFVGSSQLDQKQPAKAVEKAAALFKTDRSTLKRQSIVHQFRACAGQRTKPKSIGQSIPSRIRTCNLQLRRLTLYPIELWGLLIFPFGNSRESLRWQSIWQSKAGILASPKYYLFEEATAMPPGSRPESESQKKTK